MRNKEHAGPLDTETVKRPGVGETASLLRSKWRLCLSLAKPGDLEVGMTNETNYLGAKRRHYCLGACAGIEAVAWFGSQEDA